MTPPVDLDQPTWLLAGIALALLIVLSSRRRRFSPTYLLSAGFGAAGFVLSGWVGLLTFLLALSYRVFQRLRAPWQLLITVTAAVSAWAGTVLLLDHYHRAPEHPTAVRGDDAWSRTTDTVTAIATTSALLWACLACGAVLTTVFARRMRLQSKYPYRGLGMDADRAMMYGGLLNPNLVTLPEGKRDPRRTFPASMREERLDEQGGVCAYQARVSAHPRWEPYRSGVQWHADHIVPWASGGATDYPNLQILCADCNSAKSDAYGVKAMKKVERRWRAKR